MQVPSVSTVCAGCGVLFEQPDDPGRKAVYCGGACKQRAYRARTGKTGHESRQRARQQQRRQSYDDQRRAYEEARRAREEARRRQTSRPSTRRDRAAITIDSLLRKAAATTFPHEREACLAKVAQLREKYGL